MIPNTTTNMSTVITLTIDPEVAEKARKYAAEKGNSLSELVEIYFRRLTESENLPKSLSSSKVKKLRGILKGSPDLDYKSILESEIIKKHGA